MGLSAMCGVSLSFRQFHERICRGHSCNDEIWRKEVGYRPDDKDSGFKRWLELTGNREENHIAEFQLVVYGQVLQLKPVEPMQLQLF